MIVSCQCDLIQFIDSFIEGEIEPWVGPGTPGRLAMARDDVIAWTAFTVDEIEQFSVFFCHHYVHLSKIQWNCVVLHGFPGFQPWAALGCMRLLQEHGAKVAAWLRPCDAEHRESYQELFGSEIPLAILGEEAPEAKLTCAGPIFIRRGATWVQPKFSLPHWEPWEGMEPHGSIQASVAGLPLYSTPAIALLLGDLVDHWHPATVIDVDAWKFGTTALLCRTTHWLGSRVLAVNPKGIDDQPWFDALVSKPWAGSRVSLVRRSGTEVVLDGDGPVLAFVNVHQRALIETIVDNVRRSFSSGVFVFHATMHADMPGFLESARNDPGLRPVVHACSPPGGTWCSGGVFEFGGR